MKKTAKWVWRKRWAVLCTFLGVIGIGLGGLHLYEATNQSLATERFTLPDNRIIAYARLGSTSPDAMRVILLHGAPANSSSWSRLLSEQSSLPEQYELVVVDRLGYGASSGGVELRLAAHAASIEPLLKPGCVVVGHSYGGPVALRAAAEYPELVGGLVLIAGATDPTMNDSEWARKAGDAVSWLLPDAWANANLELLALTEENDAMQDVLGRVSARVAVLHGEWDPVCPHDGTVEHLRESLVNAEAFNSVSISRGGHNLHLSETGAVGDLVGWAAGG